MGGGEILEDQICKSFQIVDINLARDRETGESKGFCFIAYEDQRSTNLAVDNANGSRLLGR